MQFRSHIDKSFWITADKLSFALYGVVFTLLVIRHLSPVEYAGYVLIYQSLFMMIVAVISSFSLQPLFKYASETEYVKPIISIAFVLLAISSVFFCIIPFVFQNHFESWFNTPGLNSLIRYVPFLVVSFVFRLFFQYIFQSKYRVKEIFFINVLFILISIGWLLTNLFLNLPLTAEKVIVIICVSSAIATILSVWYGREYIVFDFRMNAVTLTEMVKFGLYSIGNTSASFVFGYLDHYMIAFFSGAEQVALYGVAKTFSRIFDMYAQISQSLLIPVVSRLSAIKDTVTLRIIFEKAICFSFVTLIPVFLLFFLFPSYIFRVFFGDKYDQGIILVQLFSLLSFTVPWNSVIGSYYVGLAKMKTALIINIIFLFGTVFLFTILVPRYFALGATISVLFATGLITILHIRVIKKQIPFRFIDILMRVKDIWRFIHDLKAQFKILQ